MALKLLRVFVVVVFAAAADDVPITWSSGSLATLSCVVPEAERVLSRRPPPPLAESPEPKPYQWWRRDNKEVKNATNGPFEVRRESGDGIYQCSVRHHGGGHVLGYPVHVKFTYMEKEFSVHPQNVTARSGQPFVVTCDIDSAPPPTVSWLKDDQILPEEIRYHVLANQLLITDVWRSDSGLYRCIATNPKTHESRTSHAGRLHVQSGTFDQDLEFLKVHHESNVMVPRGSRVVLPCPVVGWPRPKLTWKISPPGGRVAELEFTGELLIMPRLELDQEGVYTCEVDNSPLLKTFNVTVSEPPVITLPPVSRDAQQASTVRLNCTAAGRPEPNITWYKDGQQLVFHPDGRINARKSPDGERIELIISGVTSDDKGVYQCFAQNAAGLVSSWTTLNVTGAKAAPPTGLQCWPESVKEVRLRWDKPVDKVLAYTVHISPLDAKPGSLLPKLADIEEKLSTGEPLTPYRFQVRGYIKNNAVSDLSEDVICQGQGVPIKLAKAGGDSILVSWRHFADDTPGVVQWILQYRAENRSKVHNVTLDGSVHNYTLSASPSKPLQVRLLGSKNLTWLHQDLSRVPWTSTNTATKHLDDGDVTSVPGKFEVKKASSRGFTVTWYVDDPDDSGYYYLVCIKSEDGVTKCMESKRNTATFEHLQPSSKYEIRVQALAKNRAPGPFSEHFVVTTPSEGPLRFKHLSGKYVNSTTLQITWNGPPAKYRVHYSSELILPVEQWDSIDTMNNHVLISGIDSTNITYIMVVGYDPMENSKIETIMPIGTKDLNYEYTSTGVSVSWSGIGPRVVSYSQNITIPVEQWPKVDVAESRESVEINGLDPSLNTYVMVSSKERHNQVLTIKPRPQESSSLLLGLGISGGILMICLMALAAVCIWRKRKRDRSPARRRRNAPATVGNEEEGSEMKNIGGRLANGGGSRDAGEPLLNGHVHITENPTSKTPNGKMKKTCLYEAAFDVSRHDDPDTTLETVLDPDTSAATYMLDTSRRPDHESRDPSATNSFNKLPDDNMNSELTRSRDFELHNSKIQPTLQPNG